MFKSVYMQFWIVFLGLISVSHLLKLRVICPKVKLVTDFPEEIVHVFSVKIRLMLEMVSLENYSGTCIVGSFLFG